MNARFLISLCYFIFPIFGWMVAKDLSNGDVYAQWTGVVLGVLVSADKRAMKIAALSLLALFLLKDQHKYVTTGAGLILMTCYLVVPFKVLSYCVRVLLGKINKKKGGVDPTDSKTFYNSSQWRRLRLQVFEKYGRTCMVPGCNDEGSHVDHIKPRSKYPHLALEFSNMQILCASCNRAKSNDIIVDFRKGA